MKCFNDLKANRKNRNDANRIEMVKSSVRKFERTCQRKKTTKRINTIFKDAMEYWRLFKESQHCNIQLHYQLNILHDTSRL